MKTTITKLAYQAPKDCKKFVDKLWADVQENAKMLSIGEYAWCAREGERHVSELNFQIGYAVTSGTSTRSNLFWRDYLQRYRSEGLHCYDGEIWMENGLRIDMTKADPAYNDRIARLEAFNSLNFASYYHEIAVFFPQDTTYYVDAPSRLAFELPKDWFAKRGD